MGLILFYMLLTATIISVVALFVSIAHENDRERSKYVEPAVAEAQEYGLSRMELNRIVGQVLKNDRRRVWRTNK